MVISKSNIWMSHGEIISWFKEALRKRQAVHILSDMNCCTMQDIIEILEENMERYTPEELKIISDMKGKGKTYKEISERIGRSEKSISEKCRKMKNENAGSAPPTTAGARSAGADKGRGAITEPSAPTSSVSAGGRAEPPSPKRGRQSATPITKEGESNLPLFGEMGDIKALEGFPVISSEKNYLEGTIRYVVEFIGGRRIIEIRKE